MSRTMSQNVSENKAAPFQQLDHYERLIVLRKRDPDTFMLRTSEATRRALHYYEEAKAKMIGGTNEREKRRKFIRPHPSRD
jgi:hypothetical protein